MRLRQDEYCYDKTNLHEFEIGKDKTRYILLNHFIVYCPKMNIHQINCNL